MSLYRKHLEESLGQPLESALWMRFEDAAILAGARILLWSKANALASGTARANEEWNWWVARLGAI